MNEISSKIKSIYKYEINLHLYDYFTWNIPIYRLLRFRIRIKYLSKKLGIKNSSVKKKIPFTTIIVSFFLSYLSLIKLFLSKRKADNIVFSFPRLQKLHNDYFDKFTEPLIESSSIKNSCLIFQRPLAGKHFEPRNINREVIKTDFIDVLSLFTGFLILPYIAIFQYNNMNRLFKKTRIMFNLSFIDLAKFHITLSSFIIKQQLYIWLFKKLKPRRIFVVNREIFFPVIYACKKLSINVYELQHGVTNCPTVLYYGPYHKKIDPDLFLTFGKIWKGEFFGMPASKAINVGFAYKNLIMNESLKLPQYGEDTLLIISCPHITASLLEIIRNFAEKYKNFEFHIRLHPQENYNNSQIKLVNEYKNITIQENTMESWMFLNRYRTIIGVNSTVLYEALSLSKKVGRLAFDGLNLDSMREDDGFFYLKNINDFPKFISSKLTSVENNKNLYFSDFKTNLINNLS